MTKVLIFGQLRDIIGEELQLGGANSTDELRSTLLSKYPALQDLDFKIAVNKKIVTGNTSLPDNCDIALLSPFSGG